MDIEETFNVIFPPHNQVQSERILDSQWEKILICEFIPTRIDARINTDWVVFSNYPDTHLR